MNNKQNESVGTQVDNWYLDKAIRLIRVATLKEIGELIDQFYYGIEMCNLMDGSGELGGQINDSYLDSFCSEVDQLALRDGDTVEGLIQYAHDLYLAQNSLESTRDSDSEYLTIAMFLTEAYGINV